MGARDHPRGCGEKTLLTACPRASAGSSPRVRGKEATVAQITKLVGIIPAGAGKSCPVRVSGRGWRDHPRGCGEKRSVTVGVLQGWGSSPRVRGKGSRKRCRGPGRGIIPAGAGKSGARACTDARRGDHPRGCGEKLGSHFTIVKDRGSSPRVRGKGRDVEGVGGVAVDHPRGCGEKWRRGASGGCRRGIIPAGAGKRSLASLTRVDTRDHPRGCGEKLKRRKAPKLSQGSSPRVRGKVACAARKLTGVGIIPAGAGKRECPLYCLFSQRDHPRGCGEKASCGFRGPPPVGSSPRVRGKGDNNGNEAVLVGIIPAGAGKRTHPQFD